MFLFSFSILANTFGKMDIQDIYSIFVKHPSVSTDTRKLEENAIFFALKGERFNGNAFAEKALEKCAYAVIDEKKYKKDERFILVDDVLTVLQKLAYYHRRQLNIPILAITGSNGKTTTKELIYSVLSRKYKVAATEGNLNNHIGVPLTLLQMNAETQFGVVEMGANHIDEIALLCEIAQPDFGIITNVGKAHLEGFGSFEGVKKAKGELYNYLYTHDGTAFINSDNEHLNEMNPPHKTISYGTSKFTHVQGKMLESEWFVSLKWYAHMALEEAEKARSDLWGDTTRTINTKLFGDYNFENVLAAITIGHYFRVEDRDIKEAIEEYEPTNKRSQVIETKENKVILDAYNANPTSMKTSLENFLKTKSNNKLVILGDMLELGKDAIIEHSNILYFLEDKKFENIILVGQQFIDSAFDFELQSFNHVDDLIDYLKNNPIKNQTIFVKGSRGIQLEKVVDWL